MISLDQIARRFPLVARHRPACPSLDKRVHEVTERAEAATKATGQKQLSLAAAAHNKAALIVSDCGLPDLARSLCRRQFALYMRARPLTAQAARHALEPVVNLARLLIRDGNPDAAYQLLDTLYRAVKDRTSATIDGRQVSFHDLTRSDDDHRTLCQWLWAVHLAEGTRALISAGRWEQALAHLQRHGGIGNRLLDGRQTMIIANALNGDSEFALKLLQESTLSEPWEHAVAACLTVICLTSADQPDDFAVTAMIEHYLDLACTPGLLVFRTRLGLAVVDLAS